jgi:transcriptional regulator with XRE-family HTH domain
MASELFKKLLSEVPLETEMAVEISMRITLRIRELMRKQDMTQSELCQKMGEDPEEINRWLSGMHTFTTKMLAKLHIVLGEPIITVCGEFEDSVPKQGAVQLMAEAA